MRDDQCMLWNVLIASLSNQSVFCGEKDAFFFLFGEAQKFWDLD